MTQLYPYITPDNLEKRQKYQYTAYHGEEFLAVWRQTRKVFLQQALPEKQDGKPFTCALTPAQHEEVSAYLSSLAQANEDGRQAEGQQALLPLMLSLLRGFTQQGWTPALHERLHAVIKTFEVRKRLYPVYSLKFKPADEEDYRNRDLYVVLCALLTQAYRAHPSLKVLNTLLKLNDALLSLQGEMLASRPHALILSNGLLTEARAVRELCERHGLKEKGGSCHA